MKKLRSALKIIALLSFFAPWATCNWQGSTTTTTSFEPIDSTLHDSTAKPVKDTVLPSAKTHVNNDWNYNILNPTDNSISGLGIVVYSFDNPAYFTLVACALLTLFLLFNWKFLRIKFRRGILLAINFACIIAFAITFIIKNDDKLLWGIWLYMASVIAQLLIEIREVLIIGRTTKSPGH